jgi:hypothetical protein
MPENRPGFMTRNVMTRLAFQFRMYAVNMGYMLYKLYREAMRGESEQVRTEARRALAYTFLTSGILAGVRGLPIYGPMILIMGALFGIDDPEDEALQYAKSMLGDSAGELLFKGIPSLAGADMSKRIGYGTLLPGMGMFETPGRNENVLAGAVFDAILGPFGGIVASVPKAQEAYQRGDIWRAVEHVMPKVARDPMQAFRFSGDGVTTARGDVLLAADSVGWGDFLWKFSGVQPTDVARAYEERGLVIRKATNLSGQRERLIAKYRTAAMQGDFDEMAEVRQEGDAFSAKNPSYAIKPRAWIDAVKRQSARQVLLDQTGGRAATDPEAALVRQLIDEYEED